MKKRASGGKRAGDKRRAARAIAEARAMADGDDLRDAWAKSVKKLGAPPTKSEKAHTWLARLALTTVRATALDTVMPLEQMRRDVMKQIEQASKVLDPAKLSEEIEELLQAQQELENARNISTGEAGVSPPASSLS